MTGTRQGRVDRWCGGYRAGHHPSRRLIGALRDRLNALTSKAHAFAKTADTWDALLGLALFGHNWLRPHPALLRPLIGPVRRQDRRFERRTAAMALGLTDRSWTRLVFRLPAHVTR